MFYGIYTKCLECRKKLKFQNRYYIEVDSSFFLGLTWLQYQYSVPFLNHQFSIFLKNMYEVIFILIPFLFLIPVMRQTVKHCQRNYTTYWRRQHIIKKHLFRRTGIIARSFKLR